MLSMYFQILFHHKPLATLVFFLVRSCRMHRLEWLDLNGNSLTDLGIVSLSKALCDPNSKLKSLGGWGKVG